MSGAVTADQLPNEPHKPAAASAGSRSATPAAAQSEQRPSVPPDVKRFSSGLSLLELPGNQNAIVNVQMRFRAGSVDDPRGRAGLTYLTARVMTEGGTQALSAKQLLEALFPLAAELDVRVDKELTTFLARVHRDNLAKFLPIVTDVVLHPRWDPEEFRRLRDAAVNDIEKRLRQGDDENLGKESLEESMFRGHPYERLTLGHASDLKSMSLQELQQHAGRVFTADRLTIGVAGGYPQNLGSDMAQALSALPPRSQPPAALAQAQPHGPRFVLVEKNSDSTAISMGMPWTLSRKDPDWPAMSIARSAIGEHRQTNGRLMQRLREMRGLNYGDYAYIEHFRQEGGDAATAQTGRARQQQELTIWLRPVRDENRLFAVRDTGIGVTSTNYEEIVTRDDVQAVIIATPNISHGPIARAAIAAGKHVLCEKPIAMSYEEAKGMYARIEVACADAELPFRRPERIPNTRRALQTAEAVREVSADQVNRAWRKWVDPAKLEIVLAGKDMASVKKALLAGDPTPIQYQKDATGKTPEKPAGQLATDKEIAKFPFGAKGDADVQVVGVDRMFE